MANSKADKLGSNVSTVPKEGKGDGTNTYRRVGVGWNWHRSMGSPRRFHGGGKDPSTVYRWERWETHPKWKGNKTGREILPPRSIQIETRGKKKNHPRDETDTTSVTTGERYKHQRYACDSIVQPECGPMEPSRRKPRIMAFESFPRPTRAIDGPTWACKGPTMRTCNRQKGNEMHTSESQQVLGNEYTMAPRTACTIRANKGIPQQQLKKTT